MSRRSKPLAQMVPPPPLHVDPVELCRRGSEGGRWVYALPWLDTDDDRKTEVTADWTFWRATSRRPGGAVCKRHERVTINSPLEGCRNVATERTLTPKSLIWVPFHRDAGLMPDT